MSGVMPVAQGVPELSGLGGVDLGVPTGLGGSGGRVWPDPAASAVAAGAAGVDFVLALALFSPAP